MNTVDGFAEQFINTQLHDLVFDGLASGASWDGVGDDDLADG